MVDELNCVIFKNLTRSMFLQLPHLMSSFDLPLQVFIRVLPISRQLMRTWEPWKNNVASSPNTRMIDQLVLRTPLTIHTP